MHQKNTIYALHYQLNSLHTLQINDNVLSHFHAWNTSTMRIRLDLEGTQEEIEKLFEKVFSDDKGRELLATAIDAGIISANAKEDYSLRDSVFSVLDGSSWSSFYLLHLIFLHGVEVAGGKTVSFAILQDIGRFESRNISNRIGGVNKVASRIGVTPFIKIDADKNSSEKKCILSPTAYEGIKYALEQWDDDYRRWLSNDDTAYPGE